MVKCNFAKIFKTVSSLKCLRKNVWFLQGVMVSTGRVFKWKKKNHQYCMHEISSYFGFFFYFLWLQCQSNMSSLYSLPLALPLFNQAVSGIKLSNVAVILWPGVFWWMWHLSLVIGPRLRTSPTWINTVHYTLHTIHSKLIISWYTLHTTHWTAH